MRVIASRSHAYICICRCNMLRSSYLMQSVLRHARQPIGKLLRQASGQAAPRSKQASKQPTSKKQGSGTVMPVCGRERTAVQQLDTLTLLALVRGRPESAGQGRLGAAICGAAARPPRALNAPRCHGEAGSALGAAELEGCMQRARAPMPARHAWAKPDICAAGRGQADRRRRQPARKGRPKAGVFCGLEIMRHRHGILA